jgi:hypothetical protein
MATDRFAAEWGRGSDPARIVDRRPVVLGEGFVVERGRDGETHCLYSDSGTLLACSTPRT